MMDIPVSGTRTVETVAPLGLIKGQAVEQAAQIVAAMQASYPGIVWVQDDDLCDCTFQRIGDWMNPYIGKTLRVRLCCLWERIYAEHPDLVQRLDGWFDPNTGAYHTEPAPWDSTEWDMPRPVWYRHLATKLGLSLAAVRVKFAGSEPPKRLPSKRR